MLFAAFANFDDKDKIQYTRHYLRCQDGGTLAVDFCDPEEGSDSLPILICIRESVASKASRIHHISIDGLTGGSHESYVRSILNEATKTGKWRGCVLNYRGCGYPSILTSNKFYHGGYTCAFHSPF